jgi:glycosyltransferase involved in cell wall biosynthesis
VSCAIGTDGELLARLREAGINAEFIETKFTDKWGWWSYRGSRQNLMRWLRRQRSDVVHSNDLPTHQMSSDAARALKLPRVCHHRWVFERGAIDWFNKFGAERHLFVSRALLNELCEASPRLAAGACEVVYDGLPLPEVPDLSRGTEAKLQLGLNPERPMVLFAGQIIERKGVADLLRAWHELAPRWAHRAQLVFVGDDFETKGSYRKKMDDLVHEFGIAANFVGFKSDVYRWYAAADLVVFPSTNEPLGLVALEGMAHALPVIGTTVGGIVETIVPEETGLLVPPKSPRHLASAIERLLSDPSLRSRLGAAGRKRCERIFSIESHVAAVVREYEIVLKARQTPGGVVA